jgi:hypothetical protein
LDLAVRAIEAQQERTERRSKPKAKRIDSSCSSLSMSEQ